MARLIVAIALITASGTLPVSSQNLPAPQRLPADTRCVETDRALNQRVRDLIAHDDTGAARGTSLNVVMARIASARFDCKHGYVERGLQTYSGADQALQGIEELALARTARSGANDPAH